MRSWNNRLGLIAVCLGVLALVVALGGLGPRGVLNWAGRAGHGPFADAPVPPVAPVAPSSRFERNEHGHHAPHFGPRPERHGRGGFALGHDWHGASSFGPFFPLGSPLRLAAALLMIGLGLHLLRGGGSWRGPSDRPSDRPSAV